MMEINHGGRAFPYEYNENDIEVGFGMSLRQYYAARAMTVLLSNRGELRLSYKDLAAHAFEIADAMIKIEE